MKGNAENMQIVIACNTATYKLVKSSFHMSLKNQGLYTSIQTNQYQTRSTVVAVEVTVKTKEIGKKSLYAVKFYNTTSTILVNGIKDLFLDYYSKLNNEIPT